MLGELDISDFSFFEQVKLIFLKNGKIGELSFSELVLFVKGMERYILSDPLLNKDLINEIEARCKSAKGASREDLSVLAEFQNKLNDIIN